MQQGLDRAARLFEQAVDMDPANVVALGNLGPVSEGLFIWVFGLGIMIGFAVWLGQKSA